MAIEMGIDDAIITLQQELEMGGPSDRDDYLDEALKQGIEALKDIKELREILKRIQCLILRIGK